MIFAFRESVIPLLLRRRRRIFHPKNKSWPLRPSAVQLLPLHEVMIRVFPHRDDRGGGGDGDDPDDDDDDEDDSGGSCPRNRKGWGKQR